MLIQRRSFLAGLAASLAAPAIVRATSLMPVRSFSSNMATFYVNNGFTSERQTGTYAEPFTTIQKAMDHIRDNIFDSEVTIHIGPGYYAPFSASLRDNQLISLRGSGADKTWYLSD